jgi:hypothetical protein
MKNFFILQYNKGKHKKKVVPAHFKQTLPSI